MTVTGVSASLNAPAEAAPNDATLTFVIEKVRATSSLDATSAADFYPQIDLAGSQQGGPSLEITDDNEIEPNWTFSTTVNMSSAVATASIHLELYDADGVFNEPRDHVDITNTDNDRDLDLTVNLTDCALKDAASKPISGDLSEACGSGLVTSGDASDRA